ESGLGWYKKLRRLRGAILHHSFSPDNDDGVHIAGLSRGEKTGEPGSDKRKTDPDEVIFEVVIDGVGRDGRKGCGVERGVVNDKRRHKTEQKPQQTAEYADAEGDAKKDFPHIAARKSGGFQDG